tara:strand:+ start:702 stop:1409 length:708 start_codon:yes stop_codon:yes gene_type:complete
MVTKITYGNLPRKVKCPKKVYFNPQYISDTYQDYSTNKTRKINLQTQEKNKITYELLMCREESTVLAKKKLFTEVLLEQLRCLRVLFLNTNKCLRQLNLSDATTHSTLPENKYPNVCGNVKAMKEKKYVDTVYRKAGELHDELEKIMKFSKIDVSVYQIPDMEIKWCKLTEEEKKSRTAINIDNESVRYYKLLLATLKNTKRIIDTRRAVVPETLKKLSPLPLEVIDYINEYVGC